jgi:regulator of replication initiation timing
VKDITDISYLAHQLSLLSNQVQVLEKENTILRFKLHQTELENTRLKERVSHYETPKKDSHNSHIPPSKQALS